MHAGVITIIYFLGLTLGEIKGFVIKFALLLRTHLGQQLIQYCHVSYGIAGIVLPSNF